MAPAAYSVAMDPDLLRLFCFHGGLLVAKMLAMPWVTSRQRQLNQVFANAEDAKFRAKGRVDQNFEAVERTRRAHLNDMEGIYLFFAGAGFYLLTGPDHAVATNLFRAYTALRYAHTVCYLNELMPWRGIVWMTSWGIQAYMAYKTIAHFW